MNETNSVSPLRQRNDEDMARAKLNPHTQRSHVYSCKRFSAALAQNARRYGNARRRIRAISAVSHRERCEHPVTQSDT